MQLKEQGDEQVKVKGKVEYSGWNSPCSDVWMQSNNIWICMEDTYADKKK